MNRNLKKANGWIVPVLLFLIIAQTAAQSGGNYTMTKFIIGTGGDTSSGGGFIVNGTIGQTATGGQMQGGGFSVYGGFWTPEFTPTAATVTVSGRVFANGTNGLKGAAVVMSNMNGQTQQTRTSLFGYFSFENVEVGQTYIFSVISNRYQFAPQVVTVTDEINMLNFNAID